MRIPVRTLLVLGLVVLASSLAFSQGGVNFSGTWILDKSKSSIPQPGGRDGQGGGAGEQRDINAKLVIEQQGATLKVTRIFHVNGRERSLTHTYSTDGKETTQPGLRGSSITAKASWEGDRLMISSIQKRKTWRGEVSREMKEVWSLSPDGRTLTIDATSKTPRGERTAKAVFNKQ